jgi:oxygen-independent coproporphyrinogen-3 oxidase
MLAKHHVVARCIDHRFHERINRRTHDQSLQEMTMTLETASLKIEKEPPRVETLDEVLEALPSNIRRNTFVERAAEAIRALGAEDRLRELKQASAGLKQKPYLHALHRREMRPLSYDEVVASCGEFPTTVGALYLHFPFCTKKCLYCHYYKTTSGTTEQWDSYPAHLLEELSLITESFKIDKIGAETVHFGGGTPSLIGHEAWRKFLSDLWRHVDRKSVKEVALEVDPSDVTSAKVEAWVDSGVDRLSIGAQSFDDPVLRILRRSHTAEEGVKAVKLCRHPQITNVNIDLMYGMPGRDMSSWLNDLQAVLDLAPHSATAYATRPDPENRLERSSSFPSEMFRILAHQVAVELFAAHGYYQDSPNQFVSALDGVCLAKHARNRCDDVLGVGPHAHSIFQGWFYENQVSYAEYPSLMTSRKLCPLLGNAIDGWEAKRRFVQFGLKLSGKGKPDADNGVVVAEYRRRFGSDLIEDFHDTLTTLTNIGLLEPDWKETVRLTPAGLLLSYHVVKQF